MAAFLFVHGINVRGEDLGKTVAAVKVGLAVHFSDPEVHVCAWGDDLGAKLGLGGVSIPDYETARAGASVLTQRTEAEALWSVLYEDPLFEVRMLANSVGTNAQAISPTQVAAARSWDQRVLSLLGDSELDLLVLKANLADEWKLAISGLATSPEFKLGLSRASSNSSLAEAVARCLASLTITAAIQHGKPPIQGALRDEIVLLINDKLGGQAKGLISWILNPIAGFALKLATSYGARKRGVLSDSANPIVGDLLVYQTRGEPIRERIAAAIASLSDDVCIIAHSLGGVAVIDTLCMQPSLTAKVRHVFTVGSQAGYFYELNSLQGLRAPSTLPAEFPRWTNFYDRSDFLSFLAAPVFKLPTDVEVSSDQPFPQSHSAYWTSELMWECIAGKLTS